MHGARDTMVSTDQCLSTGLRMPESVPLASICDPRMKSQSYRGKLGKLVSGNLVHTQFLRDCLNDGANRRRKACLPVHIQANALFIGANDLTVLIPMEMLFSKSIVISQTAG